MPEKFDLYQHVTDKIVAAIEAGASGGDWKRPWHVRAGAGSPLPYNLVSGRCYRGINTTILWAEGMAQGYASNAWGTYKQWADRGGQVRKGERGTMICFWKFDRVAKGDTAEGDAADSKGTKQYVMVRGYTVFNAAQQDGWVEPAVKALPEVERNARADAWFGSLDMQLRHGGDRACYMPGPDVVIMPEAATFKDVGNYYSTLAHEATHWTGPKSRCDRDLTGRFGTEAYAAEELVAELGAAFICGALSLDAEPRPDHAQYVAGWLTSLKNDKRAIFTAASAAQKAVDWMQAKQPHAVEQSEELEEAA
jgi:antirestriction protein ArdC